MVGSQINHFLANLRGSSLYNSSLWRDFRYTQKTPLAPFHAAPVELKMCTRLSHPSPTADFPELRGFPFRFAAFWGPMSCEVAISWPAINGNLNTTYIFASTWATKKAFLIPLDLLLNQNICEKITKQATNQPTNQPSNNPTNTPIIYSTNHPSNHSLSSRSSFKTPAFPLASSGSFKETSASKIMDTDITPETDIHPRSLTARPWKMVVGRRSGFLLGFGHFSRAFALKLREGNPWKYWVYWISESYFLSGPTPQRLVNASSPLTPESKTSSNFHIQFFVTTSF